LLVKVLRQEPSIRFREQAKEIKYTSDYQLNWCSLIPSLRNYQIQRVDFLSIAAARVSGVDPRVA
jgi:hypothetical protein